MGGEFEKARIKNDFLQTYKYKISWLFGGTWLARPSIDARAGGLAVGFGQQVAALVAGFFGHFHHGAVAVGGFVLPDARHLPAHAPARCPARDAKRVLGHFLGYVQARTGLAPGA